MIETAIHVLIGFLAAALLGMMAMPAISRRAFRLAEVRGRLLAPLSASQAQADINALRGRHAVEVLNGEQRIEATQRAAQLAQIELGQRAHEIADRDAHIAEKSAEIDQQRIEIKELRGEIQSRDVEIASREIALLDLTLQRDASARSWADAQSLIDEQQRDLQKNRSEIASLKARMAELANELIEQERAFVATAAENASKVAEATNNLVASRAFASRLESQVFDLESRHAALHNDAEGRAIELQRLRQKIDTLEPQLTESERLRDELSAEQNRQMMRAAEKEAELLRQRSAHREEIERFQDRLSGAAARESELIMRIQALIAARVDAEGATRAAVSERDRLGKDLASLREKLASADSDLHSLNKGDAVLRRAISRLGHDFTLSKTDDGTFTEIEAPASRRLHVLAASALEGEDKRPPSLTLQM